MRKLAVSIAFLAAMASSSAFAQSGSRDSGLIIDVKPRSWLDAGKEVRVGQGRDYATSAAFGGGPVNGLSSRGFDNLPGRGGAPLIQFEFLGANMNR